MPAPVSPVRTLLLAALLGLATLGGCANWRAPAIDPSGDRVFAPAPQTTTFVNPFSNCSLFNCTKPAFTTPPALPPCDFAYVDPADPCDALLGAPVPCPDPCAVVGPAPVPVIAAPMPSGPGLVITPARLVSPIGSEVVLSAGVADQRRVFQASERIEWMLSQDSVGNFVEVGKDDDCFLTSWLHHTKPEKQSSDYAIGYASRAAKRLTRGTPTPVDDVNVPAGHSWLSLTSATEGTSHVTAFAPGATQWDRRQQTATIYWIDAQWAFPPPAVARAGEKQVLTTTVTRASNGSPLIGWVVRYEVVGGPAAGFGAQGDRVIEAATNQNGQAAVEIAPQGNESGQTQIAIQVIRPAGADGLPRLAVGQGGTSVAWSAPGLAVRLVGPEIAAQGAPATYRIEVTNPGDLPARGVSVSDALPAGLVHESSSPAAQILGDRLTWQLGDLPAQSTQVIELTCTVAARGDVRQCATARTADGLTAESCLVTRLIQRSLDVKMTGPPGDTARVGDTVQYVVEITNTGTQPLRGISLRDTFGPGLRHPEAGSPIVKNYPELAAGETARISLTFTVLAPGQQCHELEIGAEGEQTIVARGCLTAVAAAPQPQARLRITNAGPPRRAAGEVADFVLDITNVGDAPLTNLRIVDTYAASLRPVAASEGVREQGASLHWIVDQLPPGKSVQLQIRFNCLAADPRACNRVTVASDQTPAESQDACLEIQAGAGVPPGENPGAGVNPAATGKLLVTMYNSSASIAANNKVNYFIAITNDRNESDKNVRLQIMLPAGMSYSGFFAPQALGGGLQSVSNDGRTLYVTPIAELRPGEKIEFRLELKTVRAGEQVVEAQATSMRQTQPVSVRATTSVFDEGGMR